MIQREQTNPNTVHTEIAKWINWKAILTAQKFKLQLQTDGFVQVLFFSTACLCYTQNLLTDPLPLPSWKREKNSEKA